MADGSEAPAESPDPAELGPGVVTTVCSVRPRRPVAAVGG
ncbi:hypothetical protein ABH937_002355 [Kitasatospora sp. GAS1066B]